MDEWDACCTCGLFVYSLYNVVVSANRTSEQGRRKGGGGSWGSDDPPFLGANFIHFLYNVLGSRSVQK